MSVTLALIPVALALRVLMSKNHFDGWVGSLQDNENTNSAKTFPTNFRDGELLFRTLKEFGIHPVRQGSDIACKVEESHLTFRQAEDGIFHVEIGNAPDLQKVHAYLTNIDEDYKRCVQTVVYEKLKQRIAHTGMTVESEEVMEDNSIVVTLNIRS